MTEDEINNFHKWWYSHMENDWMQPPLTKVNYSVAKYIWDSAISAKREHVDISKLNTEETV